ncbi:hypothetical protein GW17_00014030 [Ensete ventricosum]|uniref:Uncharacterized protein n=1 Tax=Ensete ventricosum TaxID=4639 RepID=A0A444FGQ8_ENSVE|nr:hypothetical protein GW17_00014030 [Ensete ventricosum]RZR70606.1 hypothetical protein BHM03_00000852 [Ensete ventricosum]
MAGADYVDCDIDFDSLDEDYPPYLLAANEGRDHEDDKQMDDEKKKMTKELLVSWAKMVASSIRRVFAD